MIDRRAAPGLALGVAGLFAAIAGIGIDQAWLVALAGAFALLAGGASLLLTEQLRQGARRADALAAQTAQLREQSDLLLARAAQFEAEVLNTRVELAESIRSDAAAEAARSRPAGAPAVDPVTDALTGLFNERFFMATLEKRVSAARRGLRPLALGLVEVVTGLSAGHPRPSDATMVAHALLDTLREADTVARFDDGRFALLLEDTPENGAIWTIERVRRRIAETEPGHTLWAGLSCYPAHAFETDDLLSQAAWRPHRRKGMAPGPHRGGDRTGVSALEAAGR